MHPARFPKFLSVLLLGLVMPVHADTMLYSNILFSDGTAQKILSAYHLPIH